MPFIAQSETIHALIAVGALSIACALLSVVVVLKRWAFIGEGIGHSGYGGAGIAWLLALAFPQLDTNWFPYVGVVVLCTLTALSIGRLARDQRINTDAAIGVFLVAWLAVGFLAQQIYYHHRGTMPFLWDTILFGRLSGVSSRFAIAAVCVALVVILVLGALFKEILAYCFDPLTARTSGVRVNVIHDVLMILLALVIVFGTRIAGSVLVTSLLILPATTALLLTRRLGGVIALSIGVAALGAVGGVGFHARWAYIPVGPAMVLSMFVIFLTALTTSWAYHRHQ